MTKIALSEEEQKLVDPNKTNRFLGGDPYEILCKELDEVIVGENKLKRLVILACASSKLYNPCGLILQSEAGSGKTHVVREVLKFFPESSKIILAGNSKKALIHRGQRNEEGIKQLELKGKILVMLEQGINEESLEILRPILSKDVDKFRFETTVKRKNKEGDDWDVQVTEIVGCPAWITTTTNPKYLPETGSRVFNPEVDESEEQTERILSKKTENRKNPFSQEKINYKSYQTYFESLKPYTVYIPFVDLIKLPKKLSSRRNFDKIISIIEIITLMRQDFRPKTIIREKEYLVATLEDLYDAIEIIDWIMPSSIDVLPQKLVTFLEKLKNLYPAESFRHKDVAEALHISQNTVRNYCWQLLQAGKLTSTREGRENEYKIIESVTTLPNVTIIEVTLNSLFKSLISTKEVLVTEIKDNKEIENLLKPIYLFPVTDNTRVSFWDLDVNTYKDNVTKILETDNNISNISYSNNLIEGESSR